MAAVSWETVWTAAALAPQNGCPAAARRSSARLPTPIGPSPIHSEGASGAGGSGWKTSRPNSTAAISRNSSRPIPSAA